MKSSHGEKLAWVVLGMLALFTVWWLGFGGKELILGK